MFTRVEAGIGFLYLVDVHESSWVTRHVDFHPGTVAPPNREASAFWVGDQFPDGLVLDETSPVSIFVK